MAWAFKHSLVLKPGVCFRSPLRLCCWGERVDQWVPLALRLDNSFQGLSLTGLQTGLVIKAQILDSSLQVNKTYLRMCREGFTNPLQHYSPKLLVFMKEWVALQEVHWTALRRNI
ncbi:hypothetical protein Salat_1694600 [Sesamum alatum]|uniref:Uncharacterized protein n=1 Tax=Sesamum alatum TaxID=300844 RepID=A0AAE1Y7H7_9LAMI|nr:hypothetical protein Salat_1694600 [Sesamum alatum]